MITKDIKSILSWLKLEVKNLFFFNAKYPPSHWASFDSIAKYESDAWCKEVYENGITRAEWMRVINKQITEIQNELEKREKAIIENEKN